MNQQQFSTKAIVLGRVNYGEADRIVTVLTSGHGKLALIAKGVRREKSKLAGGIELFSVSEVSVLKGRGEVDTLTSSRLATHFGNIVKDLERTQWAYEVLKAINKVSEYEEQPELFLLLEQALTAVNNPQIPLSITKVWYGVNLVAMLGHDPNLKTDTAGQPLDPEKTYVFDVDEMGLTAKEQGSLGAPHIKFLRLTRTNLPVTLARITNAEALAVEWLPSTDAMLAQAHVL